MHSYILQNFSTHAVYGKIRELTGIDLTDAQMENHRDILILNPEINPNTILQKPSLKIAQVKQLKHNLSQKPLDLPMQIAIITQAETMTLAAANAFLKTLEEPASRAFIFLCTQNHASLLPTIMSRCQLIVALQNQQEREFENLDIDIKALYQADYAQRMELISNFCPDQKTALTWLKQLMQKLKAKIGGASPRGRQSLATLLQNCQTIYHDIAIANVNYKLALDMLAIEWDRGEL